MKTITQKLGMLMALLLATINANAYDFEVDGIYYSIISLTNPTCEVSSGDIKYEGDIIIPSEVTYDNYQLSVTSIGESAFYDCPLLTSVTLPESVKKIEDDAFCKSGINSINIPESIRSIGRYAFGGCDNLKKAEFASIESVCSIHYDYESSYVPDDSGVSNPLYFTKRLFVNGVEITDLDIPESVTQINPYVFFGCDGLISVRIPESVIKIGTGAFCYCEGLTSATIPSSVKLIDDYAFSDCTNLSSVVISDSVEEIGSCAFDGCKNLLSITLPESIKRIGAWAFSDCINLEEIFYSTLHPISQNKSIFEVFYDNYSADLIYNNASLYVPAEAFMEFHEKTPWKYFRHIEVNNFSSVENNYVEECSEYKIYTLDGQCIHSKLEELPKGTYVISGCKNGAKVIVKGRSN